MNGWIDGLMDGWMDGWMETLSRHGSVSYLSIYARVDGWTDGPTAGLGGWMDGLLDIEHSKPLGFLGGWVDGWIDGWLLRERESVRAGQTDRKTEPDNQKTD